MTTVNVDSKIVERRLHVGKNNKGYARHKIIMPNIIKHGSGIVDSLTITNYGSGYTSAPTVVFTSTTGSGAAATATIGFPVYQSTLTNGGTGYTAATAAITGGGGTGATAQVICIANQVSSITITNGGSGYTSVPTITITGDGTGATATAVLSSTGSLKTLTVTNGGTNYDTAPTVSFTGGAGTGAAATAVMQGSSSPVSLSIAFTPPLTTSNYTVETSVDQACVISSGNKTVNGFDLTLTPLASGTVDTTKIDVEIEFMNYSST